MTAVSRAGDVDQTITELSDARGTLLARAVIPSEGDGQIEIGDSGPAPLTVARPLVLQRVHETLYQGWQESVDALLRGDGDDVPYGRRCYIGSSPKISVTCGKAYCSWPDPYGDTGGVAGACLSKAKCTSLANGCGKTNVVHYIYWYWNRCYSLCMWY